MYLLNSNDKTILHSNTKEDDYETFETLYVSNDVINCINNDNRLR